MANHSLGYRAHSVNQSSPTINEQNGKLLDLIDQIDESLGNAQALLAVANLENLANCHPSTQQRYIAVIDGLITTSVERFKELSKLFLV